MAHSSFYCVADQCFECISSQTNPHLNKVEGFRVFQCGAQAAKFQIRINDNTLTQPEKAQALHSFSFEYIHSEFSRIPDGYLFTMRSERSDELFIMYIYPKKALATCNWELNQDYTLLRFGLWMCFSIFILPEDRVAIHASAIIYQNKTVLFLGESGTGKSTHTALWRNHIPNSRLLNDDSPIVWSGKDESGASFAFAYGAPWSGKTPCYKTEIYPIAAIVRIKQAPANSMKKLSRLEAFSAIFPSAPPAFAHDSILTDGVCSIISNLIRSVPFYQLDCLPDADAAELSCKTIFGKQAESTTRTFSNEVFFEQTRSFLSEGQKVRVSPMGSSMLPFFVGGKDQVEISPIQDCTYRKFSIVFAKHHTKYVIHRLIGYKKDAASGQTLAVLLGDGNFTPEVVPIESIYGVVETVYKANGKTVHPERFCSRSAAILWYWTRPIRRYLLWLITSRKLPKYLRPWKNES